MLDMSTEEMSIQGLYAGVGIAVVPAATTLLIASSRVILVNVIANVGLRILTAGALGINIYGISLIKVPFLWKISMISAVAGGSIAALSLTACLINNLYLRVCAK